MGEKHAKCRTCGERHPLGHCKLSFGKIREKLGRVLKPAAEAKPIPERKRESDAASEKARPGAERAAKGMKARASRVAGGRTSATGPERKAKAKAPAPVVSGKIGRPRLGEEKSTIAALKPWLKLKMSERTWWRRQAEVRK